MWIHMKRESNRTVPTGESGWHLRYKAKRFDARESRARETPKAMNATKRVSASLRPFAHTRELGEY